MKENLLIAIIVGACILLLIRKFYKQLKGRDKGCNCSCEGCDAPAKGTGPRPPIAADSCQGRTDDRDGKGKDKS